MILKSFLIFKMIPWAWIRNPIEIFLFFLLFFFFNGRHREREIQIHGPVETRKKIVLELIRKMCVDWPPIFDLAPKTALTMIANVSVLVSGLKFRKTRNYSSCLMFSSSWSHSSKNDERRILEIGQCIQIP